MAGHRGREGTAAVLGALLIALAGYLHSHGLAVGLLAAGAVVCIAYIAYDVGHERGMRSVASTAPPATTGPVAAMAPAPSPVALVIVDQPVLAQKLLMPERGSEGQALVWLRRQFWVTNPSNTETIRVLQARADEVVYNEDSALRFNGVPGIFHGVPGGTPGQVVLQPKETTQVFYEVRTRPHLDAQRAPLMPNRVDALAVLTDQFGNEHSARFTWT